MTMNSENLARSYYRKVNAKDMEGLLELFAENATFTLLDGRQVKGHAEMREMYKNVFAQGGPQPSPVNIVPAEDSVAAEVELRLADGAAMRVASFFGLNSEGKVTSVSVYRQG